MSEVVSIVVPCYEVERYIQKFFDSLIVQTYRNLEIILVDDGSTDQTSEIIAKNIPLLEAEGFRVIALRQANRGLAGAVDSGLQHVSGTYLTWPDPDDWLTPDSIGARVELMKQFPEAALLRSNAEIFEDAEGVIKGAFMEPGHWVKPPEGLFEKLLFLSTFFAPVCHMVRTPQFFEVYPEKSIYVTPRASQNLQMLLPLVERYPAIETARCYAVWRRRSDSRSQRARTPIDLIPRLEMLHEVSLHVAARLTRAPQLALEWVEQHFIRNKLLPVAYEGRMKERSLEYLRRADLLFAKRLLASAMIRARCRVRVTDNAVNCGQLRAPSQRLFNRLVRFPHRGKTYPSKGG